MIKHSLVITDQFNYFVYFQKSFGKITYKTPYHHLTSNSMLVKERFGFRCNNSTEIAIYTLLNDELSHLNNKKIIGGLFCDLQKLSTP